MTSFVKGGTLPAAGGSGGRAVIGRRNVLSLLTWAPAAAAAATTRPAHRSFDETVLYLHARLRAEAAAAAAAIDERQDIIGRINAYAQAMVVIPASDARAIAAKLDAARWSLDRGVYSIGLGEGLIADLLASAANDRDRAV